MIIGLYLILTAWLLPNLPLWYSIVSTVIGAVKICGFILEYLVTKK